MASGLEIKMASGKGNYLLPLAPVGPLHFGLALPCGHLPEGWLHLDLAAIHTKLVAVS